MEFKMKLLQWATELMKNKDPDISSTFILSFKYATTKNNADANILTSAIPNILNILYQTTHLGIKEAAFISLATMMHNAP